MTDTIDKNTVEHRIDAEIVRIVTGTRLQYLDGIPFAVLIAVVLGGAVPELGPARLVPAILWVAAVSAWAITSVRSWQRYSAAPTARTPSHWCRELASRWAVHGLIWGALVPLFWQPGNATNQALVCVLVLGVMVSTFYLLSPSRRVLLAHLVSLGIITEAVFARADGHFAEVLAVIFPLFAALVARYGWQMSGRYREAVRIRLKNEVLAQSLAAAKLHAEQASEAKSQFLANMSHELRTPLNAILGFSEMIASRTMVRDVGKHYEYAELIHDSARHLLALINDILDLAKIEAGQMKLDERSIDLPALFADATSLLVARAAAEGVELACENERPHLLVRADPRALKQIMLNLLTNALKFTPSGGAVTAFVRLAPGGGVAFGVRDTGIGIAKEDQVRVFANFGQGRHDIKTFERGTGLGLPIVKGLAEAHGGEVTLKSAVGQGTTVTITLPASRVLAAERLAS